MAPKKKQEKMALGDFLADQSLGSWADEMDAMPLPSTTSGYSSRRDDRGGDAGSGKAFSTSTWERSSSGVGGPPARGSGGGFGGGDRLAGYAVREALPLPDKPPYTAHLGNLAFDVTQPDVEGFLDGCEVTSVRIVEDKLDRKPKGFGYVEFATVDGLKKALTLTDSSFMGRNIRISVAEPPKERAEPTRDFSDWSRKGPLPDMASQGRQMSRGYSRGGGFDNMSDAGSERGGPRRGGYFQDEGKVRDFGNWERKGPLSPAPGAGPPVRDGGRVRESAGPRERKLSPAWGEGTGRGSDAGSRPPRREFQERPPVERAPTAAEQDSQWRSKMRPDPSPAATPDASAPTSPAAQAPKERPRLNLAKRTVSEAQPQADASAAASSKASPFGAARPADTAQRDREIAEKREIAIREKQEADAKAREEKAAKDAANKTARPERTQSQQDEKVTSPTSENGPRRASRQQNGPKNPAKQNGEEAAQREKPSFAILKRDAEGAEEGEDGDVPDADADGTIVGDKETKPQEVVREKPVDAAGGAKQNAEPTAEAMEDEGWSTVAAKPKNNRRGGARALAS